VNLGSIEGIVATMPFGLSACSATKTAIRGVTVSLAKELGPLGIGVNAITPGGVMHGNLVKPGQPQRSDEDIEAVLNRLSSRSCVGRFGEPRDIASICLFLASSASDYIAGQTIVADGGDSVA
jgi:NAD(P)-dependent dehydrogenase (short-subunit alcohol dehydrogenase family)